MTNRTIAWTFAILAVVLVVLPLIGMIAMMATGAACCGAEA